MKKVIATLLTSAIGISSVYSDTNCCSFGDNTTLSLDAGGGYRQDALQWTAFPIGGPSQPPIKLHSKWSNLEMGVVEANAQLICYNVVLKADYDYGWFGGHQGKLTSKLSEIDSSGQVFDYRRAPTHGKVYDTSGAIGYQFTWCCDTYALTPLAGYSYHYQNFKNRNFKNLLDPEVQDTLQTSELFHWYGPTLGFTASMQASCDWKLYITYQYHWLHVTGTLNERMGIGTPNEENLHIPQKFNHATGNEVTAGTTYQFCEHWFLGLKVDYKYFTGNKGKFKVEDEISGTISVNQPLRDLKWSSLLATIDLGYIF